MLLTVLVLGLLSRSILSGLISQSSSNGTRTDLYGHGAVNQVIGDLRQEIAAGSTVPAVNGSIASPFQIPGTVNFIYRPSTPAAAVPFNSGPYSATVFNTTFPNLVKESTRGVAFEPYDSNVPMRAASVNSTSDPSINGRYVSLARWNKHLLLPKASAKFSGGTGGTATTITSDSSTDTTPVGSFIAPDWILTAADGSNPTTLDTSSSLTTSSINPQSPKYVIGRYAYAIYNEGGLLDANVAGFPSTSSLSTSQQALVTKKGPAAFADLTQLPGIANTTSLTPQQVVNALVGWRNTATVQSTGTLPLYTLGSVGNYLQYLLGISTRFMTVGTSTATAASDRTFTSRQQLISFLQDIANGSTSDQPYLQDAMMYLGTFSRSLNQPSYWPDPNRPMVKAAPSTMTAYSNGNSAFQADNTYNAPFKSITVGSNGGGSFTRTDGTVAVVGEPLVKKRFALSRLMWLTYKGPSQQISTSDPLFQQYQLLYTGSSSGTPPPWLTQLWNEGTPANIKAYFGLTWTTSPGLGTGGTGGYWKYDPDNDGKPSNGVVIKTLNLVAAQNREANFFELLKAGICTGSVGSGSNATPGLSLNEAFGLDRSKADNRVDFNILQLGANIISQASPTNYPTDIALWDTGGATGVYRLFFGVEDLPYFYEAFNLCVLNQAPAPMPPPPATLPPGSTSGLVGMVQVPIVWNPHTFNTANVLPAGLGPTNFRIGASKLASPTVTTLPEGPNYQYALFPKGATGGTTDVPFPLDMTPDYFIIYAPWSRNSSPSPFPYKGAVSPSLTGAATPDPNLSLVDFSSPGAANNTEIYFDNATASQTLYREPTPLMFTTTGSGSGDVSLTSKSGDLSNVMTTVGGFPSTGIKDLNDPSGTSYIGFFLCEFPDEWTTPTTENGTYTVNENGVNVTFPILPNTTYTADAVGIQTSDQGQTGSGSTYSLEYKDPSGNWIPYQQYNAAEDFSPHQPNPFLPTPATNEWIAVGNLVDGIAGWDPRSLRWGFIKDINASPLNPPLGPTETIQTVRPNGTTGRGAFGVASGGASKDMCLSNATFSNTSASVPFTNPGAYILDPDGVLRRPMGAYVPGNITASTTVGLPLASPAVASSPSRPIILHRPFQSVAELGYVFSDTPWRNIDFFTPESGDSALLDIFCINEDYRPDAVAAGRVDLNTRQAPVIQALLSGAYRDELNPTTAVTGQLANTEAVTISQALVKRTTGQSKVVGGSAATGPLSNIADLVGRYTSNAVANTNGTSPYDGFSADLSGINNTSGVPLYSGGLLSANNIVQRFRETTMRALSDAGQAGTWNLMIDVIAQSGRYPVNATTPADFLVEGERHYWVHVAIDRSTGQVIDENIEPVNE